MANLKNESSLPMNNKSKDIRDYTVTGLGFMTAAIGTAFVVAEIPAVIAAGAGVLLAGAALNRINERHPCCGDYPDCECK